MKFSGMAKSHVTPVEHSRSSKRDCRSRMSTGTLQGGCWRSMTVLSAIMTVPFSFWRLPSTLPSDDSRKRRCRRAKLTSRQPSRASLSNFGQLVRMAPTPCRTAHAENTTEISLERRPEDVCPSESILAVWQRQQPAGPCGRAGKRRGEDTGSATRKGFTTMWLLPFATRTEPAASSG